MTALVAPSADGYVRERWPAMTHTGRCELWFVTGSQRLYGQQTPDLVEAKPGEISGLLNDHGQVSMSLVHKPVMTTAAELARTVGEANADPRCAGLVVWMHTLSSAGTWITFLEELNRPYLHLRTQFARDVPWDTIDTAYINAHQVSPPSPGGVTSALTGGFGHIGRASDGRRYGNDPRLAR